MNGPPSLVRYDQPVPAEDQAAQNLQSKLRAAKLQDKNLGNLPNGDDILHMILPPRSPDTTHPGSLSPRTQGVRGCREQIRPMRLCAACFAVRCDHTAGAFRQEDGREEGPGVRNLRREGGTLLAVLWCAIPQRARCWLNVVADELIRQVTLNLPERGLLLLRVRDEMKLTISAYQTLYESSVAFSTRKAIQAQDGIGDMQKKVLCSVHCGRVVLSS